MADITDFTSWSSTAASNQPQGGTTIGTGLDDNLRALQAEIAKWRDGEAYGVLTLTSVAGTNSITGSTSPAPTLAANQKFLLVPAATNTAATVLNVNSAGNKNVFWNGAACSGGELVVSVPSVLEYDGTQFNIVGPVIGTRITNSLGSDVTLNNTANYFDGPSVAQGTVGTWSVAGKVTVQASTPDGVLVKLWDGTTVIDSAAITAAVGGYFSVSLSGYISSPAGNLRISVKNFTSTTSTKIAFNQSGNSKDSTISDVRIA